MMRSHIMRRLMTTVLLGSAVLVAACNTVRGAGEDVQSAANTADNAM